MKAIMISIQPQWVEKILNGEKTIEIRKTMPKCKLPCKVYIYCTKGSRNKWLRVYPFNIRKNIYQLCDDSFNALNGEVVAEFQCNEIEVIKSIREKRNGSSYQYHELNDRILKQSCLTEEQILDYTNGNDLYAWHIDNLKIYDKSKELSEFRLCGKYAGACGGGNYNIFKKKVTKPFQSWGYVEDLGEVCSQYL